MCQLRANWIDLMGKISDALKKAEAERSKKSASALGSDPSDGGQHWWQFWKSRWESSQKLRRHQLKKKGLTQQRYVARTIDETGIDPRVVTYYDSDSYLSEQYRTLRTNLLSLQEETGLKTCTITSSLHGEGKSLTALNLAIVFSELSEKKVLLVDADLHKPSLHYYLNIQAEEGLSDLLQKDIPIDSVLKETRIKNLTFLPAGNLPESPSDILESTKMENLIQKLKGEFDLVLFDTPPIIVLTDAGVVGSMCDAAFLVVKAGKTNRETVDRAIRLLDKAKSQVKTAILTNIEYYIPTYIYKYL